MVLRDWKNTENAKKMTQTSQGLSKNILPNRRKLPNCVKIANSKKTRVPIFSCLNLRIMQENETGELVRHQSNTYKYPASAHTSSSRTCKRVHTITIGGKDDGENPIESLKPFDIHNHRE